jgi:hypothetical protein
MKSRVPASTAPIGAPRPFEKSIQAESQPAVMSRALMPVATVAFKSRAVHMGSERARLGFGLRDFDDFVEIGLLPDGAAADIGGLFGAHERLRRLVARARVKRGAEGIRRVFPVGACERRDLKSAKGCMGTAFAGDDVGGDVGQDFIAGPAIHQCRRHIAHSAGRQEYRGLLSREIGDAVAQQIDGRVIADLLVADFGTRHRLAHPGRRAGLRV